MNKTPTLHRKNLPNSRVRLDIPITMAHFQPAFEAELKEIASQTKLQGFRPGKAPQDKVLASVGRQRVEAGALDRALNSAYQEALKDEKLIPVEMPSVEVTAYTAPAEDADPSTEVGRFTAEVDILPEVSIRGYEKLKIKAPEKESVSQSEVDEVIDYLRKQGAKMEPVPADKPASKGMWADIMFKGSVDGVAKEEMHSEHHPLVIGEGQLIPGFEEHLEGLKPNEEKQFSITFPKDYRAKDLQGKTAEFTVKIHELKDVILPPVDPKLATQFGHKTVEALEAAIRKSLEQQKTDQHRQKLEGLVIEALLKLAEFEVPESLVQQEERRLTENTEKQLDGQPGPADLAEQLKLQARKNVQIGLALGKVIEQEKIDDSEQAMRKAVDRLIAIATN